jgi:rhodanese-related sulfurtransferase
MDRVRSGDALLVDVREPGEWTQGVAENAVLLPLTDLTGGRTHWKQFLADATGREVFLYCAAGGRSGIAARILAHEGFRAANTGALNDWAAAGWPIVEPAGH